MYADGEGVLKNDMKAVRWYRLAAEQGYSEAQLNLGIMYAAGEGVPEDSVIGYAWLNIAAAQGVRNAQGLKDFYAEFMMTQTQIAEAQELSRDYWARYVVPFQ